MLNVGRVSRGRIVGLVKLGCRRVQLLRFGVLRGRWWGRKVFDQKFSIGIFGWRGCFGSVVFLVFVILVHVSLKRCALLFQLNRLPWFKKQNMFASVRPYLEIVAATLFHLKRGLQFDRLASVVWIQTDQLLVYYFSMNPNQSNWRPSVQVSLHKEESLACQITSPFNN